ncbi:MAG: bifunctional YncE family protein/alkaline phosphatase family protein, partial [Armatimonadetes bacterium]|nr:bifunctional YncE family protein/alkaline phosphatase family protein [Armatimonadota bacterium]
PMLPVHGGRYVVVTNAGFRQALTVISTTTGAVVSRVELNATRNGSKEGVYFGLASAKGPDGAEMVFASRGSEERVQVYTVDAEGKLADTGRSASPAPTPGGRPRGVLAGVALSSDASRLYVADNNTSRHTDFKGVLHVLDTATGKPVGRIPVQGFPYAVAALTQGPIADSKVYVSSERDGVVAVVDPAKGEVASAIRTGASPVALLFDRAQRRMFVANAGSDTISVVDTGRDRVMNTITVRPHDLRGLPGATPMGMALSGDEKRLYVALADMNAVAVVSLPDGTLKGYVPAGWYPTSVAVSPDGGRLLVANGKGTGPRNPNSKPAGPEGAWGQYIPNIIEGSVSIMPVPQDDLLQGETLTVLANNRIAEARRVRLKNPGIKHVFYIIKENRTYDQVFGDLEKGNGDPSLCLFPREVTPNQHALAERFGLFDNFYCCAEVSADGWNWSVSGMANEYTVRNSMYSYSGRGRSYDYEGANNGTPTDLVGLRDVAASPGGYIWDLCLKHGVSFRNYGFFVNEIGDGEKDPSGKSLASPNAAHKRALQRRTDESFLQYDMSYADSDAWVIHDCPAPNQQRSFGARNAPSRFAAWKAEFDEYVRKGDLPRFIMIRLPRDHTAGTTAGASSPRAMVADNDYAVGQVVEAVSKSPYWPKSAIFILEDDAQAGHDHVDAHRSIALVISPFARRAAVDSRFYNTDSMLRTMELLLGLPPMCQYDAVAAPMDCFTAKRENAEPYTAILPARAIVAEVNGRNAYKADISARLNFAEADAVPDALLNNILWHAIKGADVAEPPSRSGLRLTSTEED